MPGPDSFTLSVIQAALVAAAEEMFAVLKKTAMSPIIYEVLDVGTGITDANGLLLSSGAGIPSFVGVLDKAVMRIIEIHAKDNIHDGDMFITNDPYYGGVTHLNDVVVAMPVFEAGKLIAWTASIAHWNDIGGMVAGSMSVDAAEIFQEGLRLPAVRLFERGQKISSVFDIIAANSRLPEFVQGDLWAQIAASRRAGNRLCQVVQTYGHDTYLAAIDDLFCQGRQRSLQGISSFPKGTYSIEEEQDDGAVWKAKIIIEKTRFIVDLTGNPKQRPAPFNTSRDGAVIAAQMIFKGLVDPSLFANAGSFESLEVITEPGTVFHATGTAPHGYYFETRIRLYDMLWQCLATAFPSKLPAGHFASICATVIAGIHPDTGRRYTMVEPQMGGWGATAKRNGLDAMYATGHGDTFNCPVEICEARYGIDVDYKRLNDLSKNKDLYKGGRGITLCYAPRAPAVLSLGFSRNRIPAWGAKGASNGTTNGVEILRQDGAIEAYAYASGIKVLPHDRIRISTANGGGWGVK